MAVCPSLVSAAPLSARAAAIIEKRIAMASTISFALFTFMSLSSWSVRGSRRLTGKGRMSYAFFARGWPPGDLLLHPPGHRHSKDRGGPREPCLLDRTLRNLS
jgi:hypothetical protein